MPDFEVDQTFLDSKQYATESIQDYETVYGQDFVSPGGITMAEELIAKLELKPGAKVLDVGCGLGGSAFLMARSFGLKVDGIDLSQNMIRMAQDKLRNHCLESLVSLQHGDILELEQEKFYDGIVSRDVFLHIHDKSRLFELLYGALKSSGKLLFTDYCCGEKPWPEDFSRYVKQRGYCLHTLSEYAELMELAGFKSIASTDLTDRFIAILHDDLYTIAHANLETKVKEKLTQSWRAKLQRAESGCHRWGMFTARKN